MKKLTLALTIAISCFIYLAGFQEATIASLEPCPLDNPIYTVKMTDGNEDGVYHPGDTLTFQFKGYMHPDIINEGMKIAFIDFDGRNPFEFVNVDPIDGLTKEGERFVKEITLDKHEVGNTFETDFDWQTNMGLDTWQYIEFEVSGTVREGATPGSLAVHILTDLEDSDYDHLMIADGALRTPHPHLELLIEETIEGVKKDYWEMHLSQYPPFEFDQHDDWVCIPTMPERVYGVLINIHLPSYFDPTKVETNIHEIQNLRNTEKEVTFAREDGSISFAKGLNLVDFREQLQGLETEMSITYDSENNAIRARVNTQILTFLANHSATINFFGVAERMGFDELTEENFREYLNVSVFENDEEVVDDLSNYFDWDEATYNVQDDILSLPVNHFTEYVLGQRTVEETTEDEVVEEEDEEELPETGGAIIVGVAIGTITLFLTYQALRKKKFNI